MHQKRWTQCDRHICIKPFVGGTMLGNMVRQPDDATRTIQDSREEACLCCTAEVITVSEELVRLKNPS